ncbi:unnamed protein product [Blepharisma stoltei]|uniref:Uncharacterized protein n=1 Tax=Blepharisma stoltei TaxID=1481888 RepID=A0AAU9K530_9CILI|nr:unnamed protein product [Blepharisma stoltei]
MSKEDQSLNHQISNPREIIFTSDIEESVLEKQSENKSSIAVMLKDKTKKFVNKIKHVDFSKITGIFEKPKEEVPSQMIDLQSMESFAQIKINNELMRLDAALSDTNSVIDNLYQIMQMRELDEKICEDALETLGAIKMLVKKF